MVKIDKQKLDIESKKYLASCYLKISELINKACNLYDIPEKEVCALSGIDKLPFNNNGTNRINFSIENLVKLLILNQMAFDLKPNKFDISISKKDLLNEFLKKQKEEFELFVKENNLQELCCLSSNETITNITNKPDICLKATDNNENDGKLNYNDNFFSLKDNFDICFNKNFIKDPKNISYSFDEANGESFFTLDLDGKHFADKTWEGLIEKIKNYLNK